MIPSNRNSRTVRFALLLAALFGGGCAGEKNDELGFETGPLMRPGDDCLRCHSEGSPYPQAKHWTLGGTVYSQLDAGAESGVAGAQIVVSDASGSEIERLTSNAAGNFYTATQLPAGFRVAVEYEGKSVEMPCPPPAGNCGACHSSPPIGGPLGRVVIPRAVTGDSTFDCSSWMRR